MSKIVQPTHGCRFSVAVTRWSRSTQLLYIEPKSRIDRPRKTKICTEIAHVTRDWDTTFKVKVQGHQAALLSAALTRKSATVVSVGTCSVWESTAMLRLIGGAGGAWAPTGGGQGRGHIVSPRAQLVIITFLNGGRRYRRLVYLRT